jgi:hypothetical protein
MRTLLPTAWLFVWLAGPPAAAAAAFPPDQIEFFEKQIRPLLAERCFDCHGGHRHESGLRLDTHAGVLRGTDYGKVVEPGNPAASQLIKAVRHEQGAEPMPKKGGKLSDGEIALLEKWITMGVPWPEEKAANEGHAHAPSTEPHWAFQPVKKPAVAHFDALVQTKLKAAGLDPAPPADDATLMRRLYLTLTGLPPTYEQAQTYLKDTAPGKTERLIDALLASPRYGERWGRYWLDVARYSDTEGYQVAGRDIRFPYAYTYRDWVIRSLNEDMPYDQFLTYQLAADRLEPVEGDKASPHLAALGYLTIGDSFIGNRDLQTDDRIDVVTRGMLGLTVSCARCHDHKFDPVPTKDYYALYSIFNSSEIPEEFPVIGSSPSKKAAEEYAAAVAKVEKKRMDFHREVHAEIRSPESLQSYLLFVRDAMRFNWQNEEYRGKAGQAKVRDKVASAWIKFMQKQKAHPVMLAWSEMATVKDEDFATKAEAMKTKLTAANSPLHPTVRNELTKRVLKSPTDLAKLYTDVIHAALTDPKNNNADWQQVKSLLASAESPLSKPIELANEFFTRKDLDTTVRLRNEMKKLETELEGAPPRAMAMFDKPKPNDVAVFIRGNAARRGEVAPRANLSLLGGEKFTEGSGRLELAKAITSKDNPLTARVMVNRVWLQHFGAPLVNQTSDFGVQTEKPVQADVLDHLAAAFMDSGWSLKALHRLILNSATFQQSTSTTEAKKLKDADNSLLSRFNRQRLDYESMRDAVNFVAGTLELSPMGGRSVSLAAADLDKHRTVYHFVDRYEQATVPAMFDFANPDAHSPQRYATTVPQQALFLMNSPYMKQQATRLATAAGDDITALYRRALLRDPKPQELQLAQQFLEDADSLRKAPVPYSWRYGLAAVAKNSAGKWALGEVTALKHFDSNSKRWSPAPKVPEKPWGHLLIQPGGGHPGIDAASVMTWTSPFARETRLRVGGEFSRPSEGGNGVRVLLFSSIKGLLKEQVAAPKAMLPIFAEVTVQKGESIHFVVDSIDRNTDSDSYTWTPRVERLLEDGNLALVSRSETDYCDGNGWPLNRAKPQAALAQLAQVLLMSNEFMFFD